MNEILMNCDYLVISELSSHANKELQNEGRRECEGARGK